jgi:hypothetical protein
VFLGAKNALERVIYSPKKVVFLALNLGVGASVTLNHQCASQPKLC